MRKLFFFRIQLLFICTTPGHEIRYLVIVANNYSREQNITPETVQAVRQNRLADTAIVLPRPDSVCFCLNLSSPQAINSTENGDLPSLWRAF